MLSDATVTFVLGASVAYATIPGSGWAAGAYNGDLFTSYSIVVFAICADV